MNEIPFPNLNPTISSQYFCALGLMRLLSKEDPDLRGCWKNDQFTLHTSLTRDEIVEFFLTKYEPSSILSPWNADFGLIEETNKDHLKFLSLDELEETNKDHLKFLSRLDENDERFGRLKHDYLTICEILSNRNITKSQSMIDLRSEVSDSMIEWMDTVGSPFKDGVCYSPLLVKGGCDGRAEFASTFLKILSEYEKPKNRQLSERS